MSAAPATRHLRSAPATMRRWQIATATASVVALMAVGLAVSSGDEPPARLRARFVLNLPDSARMSRVPGSVTVSHDGRMIAFLTRGPGVVSVWVRRLDQLELHRVAGTEGAARPRFSPDGRAIAFTVGSSLRRVPVEGGPPTTITDSVSGPDFAWLNDGTIVFTRPGPDGRGALWKISVAGGTAVPLTTVGAGELEHDAPARLPGGKAVVFVIDGGGLESNELAVVRIADGAITRLGIKGRAALYADGFLFFVRPDGTYGAVPFDAQRARVTGEAITVDGRGTGSIGENGMRVHYPNADAMELVSVDRQGTARRLLAETRGYYHPRLSPDGHRLLVAIGLSPQEREIWVIDLDSGTLTKLSSGGFNYPDGWTPDGRRVIWTHGGRSPGLWWQPWDASTPPERMLDSAQGVRLFPGREEFMSAIVRPGGRREVRIVPLPVDTTRWSDPITLRRAPTGFAQPRPSPDGKWIAFVDEQSGISEVFVYARAGGGRYQVSVGGGDEPVWNSNGTELFYRAPQRGMMAATLALGTEARVVRRDMLFPLGFAPGGVQPNYDVTADGRFIIPRPIPITEWPIVVIGWTDELREQQRGTR